MSMNIFNASSSDVSDISKNKFNSDRNNSCKNETSDMSDTSDEETSELTDNISVKEESMYRLSNTVNTVT
jgi:hypothetical protein